VQGGCQARPTCGDLQYLGAGRTLVYVMRPDVAASELITATGAVLFDSEPTVTRDTVKHPDDPEWGFEAVDVETANASRDSIAPLVGATKCLKERLELSPRVATRAFALPSVESTSPNQQPRPHYRATQASKDPPPNSG
jgi:hypothetical protein